MANSMDELKTYGEEVVYFKQECRKINLLSGNGFSIDCDRNRFSYNLEVGVFLTGSAHIERSNLIPKYEDPRCKISAIFIIDKIDRGFGINN